MDAICCLFTLHRCFCVKGSVCNHLSALGGRDGNADNVCLCECPYEKVSMSCVTACLVRVHVFCSMHVCALPHLHWPGLPLTHSSQRGGWPLKQPTGWKRLAPPPILWENIVNEVMPVHHCSLWPFHLRKQFYSGKPLSCRKLWGSLYSPCMWQVLMSIPLWWKPIPG